MTMDKIGRKKGIGISHSKIILIGEHSVVYGYPAIAIPLKNIKVKCEIYESSESVKFDLEDTLSTAIYGALEYLRKKNKKLEYKVDSYVPQKRGMGSSAAVSIAGVKAVFDYFDEDLKPDILEKLVNKAEIIAHKTPSGLDAKTCLSDKAIKFIKDKGFKEIDIDLNSYLVIADTGIHGQTRDAIENVKKIGERAKENLKRLGEITDNTEKAIKEKDIFQIGKNMTKAHKELKKLNVTIKESDDLVEEAINNGALGAKMSGGGLGGCIIALVDEKKKAEKIGKKLIEKGAENIWIEVL